MKRSAIAFVLMLLSVYSAACTRVTPGHVGIQVTLSGTDRGVSSYPVVTGRVWYNPYSTDIIEYPTFVQTAKWTASATEGGPADESITFTNNTGMQFSADISLSYHLVAAKVPNFYVQFRQADINVFTHGFLRNVARDQFDKFGGKYSTEQIMGDNAEFISNVRKAVSEEVKEIGVIVDQFGFIGAPRPPVQIQKAINDKNAAEQLAHQKENELKQVAADAAKVIEKAKGDAEAKRVWSEAEAASNRRISDSLSTAIVEMRRLEKWDGKLPYINGGSTNPFVSLAK